MQFHHITSSNIVSPTYESTRLEALPAWKAALACCSTLFIVIPVLLLPESVAGFITGSDSPYQTILAGLVGVAGAVAGFLLWSRCMGIRISALFLQKPDRTVIWSVLAILGISTVLLILTIGLVPGRIAMSELTSSVLLMHVATALAIGLWTGTIEELFLRGAVLAVLGNQWSWSGALIWTSLLFGLLHTGAGDSTLHSLFYVILTTLAGLLFGVVTLATGSIWHAVAMHATWNTIFSGYLVTIDSAVQGSSLIHYELTASNWLVTPYDVPITESPLAIFLFGLTLFGAFAIIRRKNTASIQ